MLSKFLTVVLLVSLGGCKKEYKKSDNDKVKTVSALNDGDFEAVISKSAHKTNLSPRERYYLASAYSQKAGVDVFSLYSVMEIQLFHKKALEWSDLSKEKNPYLKFMKNQEGIDYEKREKIRAARWERDLPEIIKKYGLKSIETKVEDVRTSEDCYRCEEVSDEDFTMMQTHFDQFGKKLIEEKVSPDDFGELWYDEVDEFQKKNPTSTNSGVLYQVAGFYYDQVFLTLKKEKYLHPDSSQNPFGGLGWEMVYMNILWNTYEAIPVLKKMPMLTDDQQLSLTDALSTYMPLLENKEFKDVSLKNLMLLSGVSLLSIYSSSFDLEAVDSIQDLYCSFNPHILIDNYSLIRERILFMHRAYNTIGLSNKTVENYEDKFEELKSKFPEVLTEEQKAKHLSSVKKFQLDSCY